MKKILIIFAHPAKSRSKINMALRRAVEDLENVTVNDLYSNYPDFLIDVKREQELCKTHDIIIFQHPLYWYSVPAIIREWQDLVLEHGWAYGSQANGLEGKEILQAITAGGDESTYQKSGYNRFTINELTAPTQATANLCKMKWLPPFVVYGVHRGLEKDKVVMHSEDYRKLIISLRDETFDLDAVQNKSCCNSELDKLIKREN